MITPTTIPDAASSPSPLILSCKFLQLHID
jgi:hypothetical protein